MAKKPKPKLHAASTVAVAKKIVKKEPVKKQSPEQSLALMKKLSNERQAWNEPGRSINQSQYLDDSGNIKTKPYFEKPKKDYSKYLNPIQTKKKK